jgi:hypothetical protein
MVIGVIQTPSPRCEAIVFVATCLTDDVKRRLGTPQRAVTDAYIVSPGA